MATAKKKRPTAKTSAKKAKARPAKARPAKAAKKAAPKASKSAKRAAPVAKKTAVKRAPRRRRDLPVPQDWISGALTISNGVLGMSTASGGFVSLEALADAGEKVNLVLQLGPSRTGELGQSIRNLIDFIEARSAEAVGIIVRCCVA